MGNRDIVQRFKSLNSGLAQAGLLGDLVSTAIFAVVQLSAAPLLAAVLARGLTVEEFGTYNALLRISMLLVPLCTLGVSVGLSRYVAANRDAPQAMDYLWGALSIAVAGSVGTILASYFGLTDWIWHTDGKLHQRGWSVVGVLILLPGLTQVLNAWLRGSGGYQLANLAALVWTVGRLGIGCVLLFGVEIEPLWLLIAFFALDLLIHSVFVTVGHPVAIRVTSDFGSAIRVLLRYSVPRAPGGLAIQALQGVGVIYFSSRGQFEAAGFMSVGLTIVSFGNLVFSRLGTVLLPHFSYHLANAARSGMGVPDSVRRQLRMITAMLIAAAAISGTTAAFITPYALESWLGKDYDAAREVSGILTAAAGLLALYSVLSGAINAVDVKPINTVNLLVVMVYLAAGVTMLPNGTMSSVAILQLGGFGLLAALTVIATVRLYSLSWRDLAIAESTCIAVTNVAIMGLVANFMAMPLAGVCMTVLIVLFVDGVLLWLLKPEWFLFVLNKTYRR